MRLVTDEQLKNTKDYEIKYEFLKNEIDQKK